ncbi:MAG: glycosyltransferase, partial [Terriglobia bacterium]
VRRSQNAPLSSCHPSAALIIPCKGLDIGFEENIGAYLTQDYPDYRVILVVCAENDPAFPVLRRIAENQNGIPSARPAKISLVIAGISEVNGEKVNNLLVALERVDAKAEVLAFADSDACPNQGWLRALISPLADPSVTVSSGFRWYLPSSTFASRLQAAWDSVIVTMLGDHNRNIPWGGSMAIRAEVFRRLKIAEKYWQGTVSDDYGVAQAVRDAHGVIRFEPRCLVPSQSDTGLKSVLRWTLRQIILTRVYSPRLWLLGMLSFGLYALGMFTGVAALVSPSLNIGARAQAATLLVAIVTLGVAKGRLRLIAAHRSFPQHLERLRRHGACYWELAILTPWVMFWNFSVAAFARRIEWRGTVYDLKSRTQLSILRRSASREQAAVSGAVAAAFPDGGKCSGRD